MHLCCQQSWAKRLRDKFKKFRSRNKELTTSEDVQKMKEKYGKKRSSTSTLTDSDHEMEELVKVQRMHVSSMFVMIFQF